MNVNFKSIHIGNLIFQRVNDSGIGIDRIKKYMKYTEDEISKTYTESTLDTLSLLKWSKLLQYDFFRIYTQHLILYSPIINNQHSQSPAKESSQLPQFRKNIYTKNVVDFLLELLESGEKNKTQIISEYGIPKTTLYKWIAKYKK